MAKKIIAVQCDPESFDYRMYYNEDDAHYDLLFVDRGEFDFNKDMKKDLETMLEDIASDDESVRNQLEEYDSKEDNNTERLNNVKAYVRDFFNKYKSDKFNREIAAISDDDYWVIISYANDYCNGATSREEQVCKCGTLERIYGIGFGVHVLRGSCQGDWCEVICPNSLTGNYLDYIEAVFFGTGTEYYISEEPIETADEDGDPREMDDLIAEAEESGCCDYTSLYIAGDIKDWIAKNASYGDAQYTKDDVMLINIKSSYTVTKHNYEVR